MKFFGKELENWDQVKWYDDVDIYQDNYRIYLDEYPNQQRNRLGWFLQEEEKFMQKNKVSNLLQNKFIFNRFSKRN